MSIGASVGERLFLECKFVLTPHTPSQQQCARRRGRDVAHAALEGLRRGRRHLHEGARELALDS